MSLARRNDLVVFLSFAAAVAVFLLAVGLVLSVLLGRALTISEMLALGIVVAVAGVQCRAFVAKRRRERLDQIRDSALW